MKILFITPAVKNDIRTEYLLDKINLLKDDCQIWCIDFSKEDCFEKNKLKEYIGDRLLSLKNDHNLANAVLGFNPDILSFEEFPETFISQNELDVIYDSDLTIFETTFDGELPRNRKYKPNKIIVTNKEHFDKYYDPDRAIEMVKPPVKNKIPKVEKNIESPIQSIQTENKQEDKAIDTQLDQQQEEIVTTEFEHQEESSKLKHKVTSFHILTDIDSDREINSQISLSKLEYYGIDYIQLPNKRYTDIPPSDNCEYPDRISMEPGGKLTPGHYGCYLAHKSAFYKGLNSGSDFILIFECDCVIDVDYLEFIKKINFACDLLNKTDILMFSFGFHNNQHIIEKNQDYWVVDRFYGAHAYLVPKKSFEKIDKMYRENKWNVTDLLFAEKLNMYKIGIFEKPITKQVAGFSILDKVHHEDRY